MPLKKGQPRPGPVKIGGNGKWGFDIWLRDPLTGRKTKRVRSYEFERREDAAIAAAAIMLADRDEKYGLSPAREQTLLADLVKKRLSLILDRAEKTRATRVLQGWLKILPAGIKVEQLTGDEIQKWIEKRTTEGQSPGSVDRELNIITATLNAGRTLFASLGQWLPPKFHRPRLPKTRRERLISDEEYNAILNYLRRPRSAEERQLAYQARIRASLILRFALLTGMRPKEIWRLEWSDIDYVGKTIKVRGTKTERKTNSTRYIPLAPFHTQILQERRMQEESLEFVFSMSGSPRDTDYGLLKEACEANGISYGRSVKNGFELYCARHTYTTRLLQAGMSLSEIGKLTGHSNQELVLYYSHITPESASRAVQKIQEIEENRLKIVNK